jgi:hypothetical protein
MSEWRFDAPPKDRPFLTYGKPSDIEGVRWFVDGVHLAYWDDMDSEFCIKGATWMGPFIEPKAWMEEPDIPVFPTT